MASNKSPPKFSHVVNLVMFGLESAGKTVLAKQLRHYCSGTLQDGRSIYTMPTPGVELDTLYYRDTRIKVKDVSSAFVRSWPKYVKDTHVVLYLVDASLPTHFGQAIVELYNVVGRLPPGVAVLVLLSKCDAPAVMSMEAFEYLAHIPAARAANPELDITVAQLSTLTGEGIDHVLHWLVAHKQPAPAE